MDCKLVQSVADLPKRRANGPIWAKNSWHVFLFTPSDVIRAIRYVENNPLREGKPRHAGRLSSRLTTTQIDFEFGMVGTPTSGKPDG